MKTLEGQHIKLRALEPEDLEFVLEVENDENIWHLSHTQTPFSKYAIKQYLEHAHKDIYDVKQLRLAIVDFNNNPLGLIDLFDFDFKNKRAGVGVIIKEHAHKGKGYGNDALEVLIAYSFKHLGLHQLYCNISETNVASLKLFKKQGFEIAGLKKDWNFNHGMYENEYILQLIKQ